MNIYKRLLFIINPSAGIRKKDVPFADMIMDFSDHGYETVVCFTRVKGDGTALVCEHAGDSIDMIVCMGGDGTLNEVVAGARKIGWDKAIGYIPAGSTNDFAASLGIPGDPSKAASQLIEAKERTLDIGLFNKRSFIYTASCGIFASTSYVTPQRAKNLLGHFAYILEGAKDITQFHPMAMKIEAEGKQFEGSFIFVALCNTFSLGGVMTLDRDVVDLSDGYFELLMIREPKDLIQLNLIRKALMEQEYDTELVKIIKVKKARVSCEDAPDWSLDGEYAQGKEVCEFEVLPSELRMKY